MIFLQNIAGIFSEHGMAFLKATWTTIAITAISLLVAMIIGLFLQVLKFPQKKSSIGLLIFT